MLSQLKLVGYGLLLAGLVYGSYKLYNTGYDKGVADEHQKHQEAIKESQKRHQILEEYTDKLEKERKEWLESKDDKPIIKEIIKYVEKPNSSDCSLDDDFMRIYKDAVRGSKSESASKG